MTFKPSDFFFGLIEFLAYIAPGSIFCYVLYTILFDSTPDSLGLTKASTPSIIWFLFILISYILGHIIHHISALILNPLYSIYLKSQLKKHQAFISQAENSIKNHLSIHDNYLELVESFLKMNYPLLISDLDKYEANSKLFRSICIICLFACFYPSNSMIIILFLIFISILSFLKFLDQKWNYRFKAYEYFLLIKNNSN